MTTGMNGMRSSKYCVLPIMKNGEIEIRTVGMGDHAMIKLPESYRISYRSRCMLSRFQKSLWLDRS